MNKQDVKIRQVVLKKNDCNSAKDGKQYTVVKCPEDSCADGWGIGEKQDTHKDLCHCYNSWTLVTQISNSLTPSTFMANLLQRTKLLFKGEPEKSYLKAGITDDNDNLTSEGKDVFLNFLLKFHGKQFNEEIVQKLLQEEGKK